MSKMHYGFVESLWTILAVIRSCPGDLHNGNVCMNDLPLLGEWDIGSRVIGSGLSRESQILLVIEGIVILVKLKTTKRCFFLKISAFSLFLITKLLLDFSLGKEMVLISRVFLMVFHEKSYRLLHLPSLIYRKFHIEQLFLWNDLSLNTIHNVNYYFTS